LRSLSLPTQTLPTGSTLKSYVKRFKGRCAIVFLGHDAFEFSHYLLGGLDKHLNTYHRDPDFAIMLAEVASEYK